jgi:hypothetical protein
MRRRAVGPTDAAPRLGSLDPADVGLAFREDRYGKTDRASRHSDGVMPNLLRKLRLK